MRLLQKLSKSELNFERDIDAFIAVDSNLLLLLLLPIYFI